MNNSSALFIAIVILAGLAVDFVLLDARVALYVARAGLNLLGWLAFWR